VARPRKAAYHHGNLRQALIDAALELLERDGLEGLSLRGVAARIGVSHAAPLHHFASLRDLLTAISAVGFLRFAASMRTRRDAAPDDAQSQMRAAMEGYVAFAVSSPALFRLMFDSSRLDWTHEDLLMHARAAYGQLAEICASASRLLSITSPDDVASLERLVWSQAHGRAHLTIDGQFARTRSAVEAVVPGTLDLTALVFGARRKG
jgi:AcrR family transcriptional regulator